MERYLGWHFNPDERGEPARFVLVQSNHEKSHKPLLLKSILGHDELHRALGREGFFAQPNMIGD
jgi:hypothetical protein